MSLMNEGATMNENPKTPLRMYVHPITVRYLDYGDLLSTETGVAWSTSGNPQDAMGFERGRTIAEVRERFARLTGTEAMAAVELADGPAVVRSHDMNPHGLI